MGTTPKYAIPYTDPADQLVTYPAIDQESAERVEALLTGTVGDTGWIDGGTGPTVVTPNAVNFNLTVSKIRVIGNRVQIFMQGTMKVVSTFQPSGDIGNLNLATVAASYIPIAAGTVDQGLTPGGAGRMCMYYITPVGGIYVGAIAGSAALAVGESVCVSGSYLI